jgi:sulfur carrier protein
MRLMVNGEEREVADGATVADLIESSGLADAACAAEVNKSFVPKRDHATTTLTEGDRIELVTLVGGG